MYAKVVLMKVYLSVMLSQAYINEESVNRL